MSEPRTRMFGISLLHVLISIGLLMTLMISLTPLLNTTARLQRESGERIQALWAIHGTLEQIRAGAILSPEKIGGTRRQPLELPVGAVTALTIRKDAGPVPDLRKITVTARWTTLQGREISVSLTEYMTGKAGR